MPAPFQKSLIFIIIALGCFISHHAKADHIFGGDLTYSWVSGNTYTVKLVLYGDCATATLPGSAFNHLNGATPEIVIYKDNLFVDTLRLAQVGTGVEVTPVCPSLANQTNCTVAGSTIQGSMQFVYTGNYTLNGTSANWLFRFNAFLSRIGALVWTAGRSNTLTNITTSGSTTVRLEATLNNQPGNNSSATSSTIPTPYFCINKPGSYNPVCTDPNGDALDFSLVSALNAWSVLPINYVFLYSPAAPLAAAVGSFSYNNTNGILNFTPNLTGSFAVVSKTTETRNGIVVGTSMREMVFIITACNNTPPSGGISNPSPGATIVNSTTIEICKGTGQLSFKINPTDIDGDAIDVSVSGLPAGAAFNVSNNNTITPSGTFSWNTTSVAPGTYTFFVTFTDKGCPLASKQTITYTINVSPGPDIVFNLLSPATCQQKAVFTLTPVNGILPVSFTFGPVTRMNISGIITDSLAAGTYTFTVASANGCSRDTLITIPLVSNINLTASVKKSICSGVANGEVALTAGNGNPPYVFAIGSGAFGASNTFTGLAAGNYIFHVKDNIGCTTNITVTVSDSLTISGNATVGNVLCYHDATGSIEIVGQGGVAPYLYAFGPSIFTTTNSFHNLKAGQYELSIKDSIGCFKRTAITVAEPDPLEIKMLVTPNDCEGYDNEGRIKANVTGGTSPYTYLWTTVPPQASDNITNLINGKYHVAVADANNCMDTAHADLAYGNCCKPFIPDAFSPNGDSRNDQFRIGWKGDIKLLNFSVYNRYGQRVFYTVSPNQGWDGVWNGKVQDLGTYFYYIKMICGNGGDNVIELKGDIILIQ